eukprot:scaffold34371_cov35-Prasinocladus_malaysianus.AAC.1
MLPVFFFRPRGSLEREFLLVFTVLTDRAGMHWAVGVDHGSNAVSAARPTLSTRGHRFHAAIIAQPCRQSIATRQLEGVGQQYILPSSPADSSEDRLIRLRARVRDPGVSPPPTGVKDCRAEGAAQHDPDGVGGGENAGVVGAGEPNTTPTGEFGPGGEGGGGGEGDGGGGEGGEGGGGGGARTTAATELTSTAI